MHRSARWVMYGGIAATVIGLSLVHAHWIADPPYSYVGTFRFGWSLLYIALLALVAYGLGLPDLPRSPRSALVTAIAAAAGGAVGVSLVQLFAGDALLPRFVAFGSAILLVPFYLMCVALAGGGSSPAGADRVLVVSDSLTTQGLRHELSHQPERPASVVAVVPVTDAMPSLDDEAPLLAQVAATRCSVLVLDREAQIEPRIVDQAARLHANGVRIRTVSLFYDEWLGKLPLRELEQISLLFDIGEVHRNRYLRIKRLVDLAFAVFGVVGLVLVLPFVAVGDLIANRGSLFYHQPRVGKQGQVFEILKFRTMRSAEAGAETVFTADGDARVTPFGRLLRSSHVDELPQVINILRGDLSVVGPRPEQPRYVADFAEKLPYYELRHLVRPGLTGWAQVKYHYGADEHDALEKLQYEFYYLRHQRLSLDVRIIGRTVRSVLGREGR